MGMERDIDPLDWRWRLEDNQLIPIMSDMNSAYWKWYTVIVQLVVVALIAVAENMGFCAPLPEDPANLHSVTISSFRFLMKERTVMRIQLRQ